MGRPKKTVWRRIADSRVRHVWKATCRCATVGGAMVGGEVALTPNAVRLSPSFYGENGEAPVCSACGAFMGYSHTEYRIK